MGTIIEKAKNKEIFVIKPVIKNLKHTGKYEVVKTDYYSHVMESAEETTTPMGIAKKLQYDEITIYDDDNNEIIWLIDEVRYLYESDFNEYGIAIVFEIFEWFGNGKKMRQGKFFKTEDAAADYIFEQIEEFDFMNDDQRMTQWFDTKEEAEAVVKEIME